MTLDQLPAGLPMDDKIEAWVQRAPPFEPPKG